MGIKQKDFRIPRSSEDYYKNFSQDQLWVMCIRCLISGHQYGIEGLDSRPKDYCIWCGERRSTGYFQGVSIPDLLADKKKVSKLFKISGKKDETKERY